VTAWNPKNDPVTNLKALMTPQVQSNLSANVLSPLITTWLAQLCLLEGVPFPHLVPNAALLPPESLRFFYVDRNWLDCLLDGAFSVGRFSSRDDALYAQELPAIHTAVDLAELSVRPADPPLDPALAGQPMAGLLLRSALVSGWPGLEVLAFAGATDYTTPVPLVQMVRLSPDLLLCLFANVPDRIEINEPTETLHFGAEPTGNNPVVYNIALRWLDNADNHAIGNVIETGQGADVTVAAVMRNGGAERVISLQATMQALQSGLQTQYQPNPLPTGPLSPSTFGIEMVQSAYQEAFVNNAETATFAPAETLPAVGVTVETRLTVAAILGGQP